ncbi:MAG: S1 RNA-binding domain-containing protein [Suipraeoptans sp.]
MIIDYLGEKCKLKVVKKVDFGYYLGDEEDKVLLPINDAKILNAQGLSTGEEVEVFIYKDSEDRIIATSHTPKIIRGTVARLNVVSTGKIGAFLDWGLPKDLMLPFREQTKKVDIGDTVPVALYVDKTGRLCATMKIYHYLESDSPYKRDEHVTGTIYEISERFGAFVVIDDKYSALIPVKEGIRGLKVLDVVNARIAFVHPDGKLDLSVRKKAFMQMNDDADVIVERMQSLDGRLPFTDKASADRIKEEFGFSKNAFKRAIGHLLKENKIKIYENYIELL